MYHGGDSSNEYKSFEYDLALGGIGGSVSVGILTTVPFVPFFFSSFSVFVGVETSSNGI